jgi:hypothetical protein
MKPKTYKILQDCIERGLLFGYNRTVKHLDDGENINKDLLIQNQIIEINNEISENFTFDETE